MIRKYKVVALVPARGNSLRLKKKNSRFFLGKPLINWTLDAAKHSKYIDKVVLSTDSTKILKIASSYKNLDLKKRPKILAKGNTSIYDVIKFELKKYLNYDILILLQPTSPLKTSKDIDKCLELMIKNRRSSCVSFTESKQIPYNIYNIDKSLKLKRIVKKKNTKNDKKYYFASGDIYISFLKKILIKNSFIHKDTYPYIIKNSKTVDINDIVDFKIGEFLLRNF